jgi:pimeloyl-ACP methyl ester carboxylesterase
MSTTVTETIDLTAADGHPLRLTNVRGGAGRRGPVLVVHGAGVRAGIFRPPGQRTVVDALIDADYDVWLLDWRASIDLDPGDWTLDAAAAHDHPAAVRAVLDATGADTLDAVVHCQGSTSFVMSAVAGLLPQVRTIVSNAVSLHPIIPWWSRVKIHRLAPAMRRLTPILDPSWGRHAPDLTARMIAGFVRLVHRECDRSVCRMVSFTYGSGFPALWRHENLSESVHRWIDHEFGPVPFTFFDQMAACVRAGHLVAVDGLDDLPTDFVAQPPRTDARFVLLAGAKNRCFLPESQVATFRYLDDITPRRHSLHVLPDYGHLDVFFGARAHKDVFPLIVDELARDA